MWKNIITASIRKGRLLIGGLLILSLLPVWANAQEINYKEQAFNLMNQKDISAAYNLLKDNYENNKVDMEYNLLLGLCSLEMQKPEEAISYYQAILAQNNDLPRVHLELAKAYAANGQNKEAQAELKKVLATNPPPIIGENIKRFLEMLETEKNTHIRATVGYMSDSNVNQGPTRDKINFAGVEFTLSKDSLKQHDNALLTNITVDNVKMKNKNQAWQSSLSYYRTDYHKYSQYDSDQVYLSTGPMFRQNKKTTSLPIIYNYTALDGKKYNEEYGLSPQIQYDLSARKNLTVSGLVKKSRYADNYQNRDSDIYGGNISQRYIVNAKSFWQMGYGYKKENAQEECYSNKSNSFSLGYYSNLAKGYALFVQPSLALNKYQGIENPGDPLRDEKQYVLVTNLSKTVGDWNYVLGYTYIRNDSNVSLHDYNRNQISLQASKTF